MARDNRYEEFEEFVKNLGIDAPPHDHLRYQEVVYNGYFTPEPWNDPNMYWNGKEYKFRPFDNLGRSSRDKEAVVWNTGRIEVLPGTVHAMSGPHPKIKHADEMELMSDEVWRASIKKQAEEQRERIIRGFSEAAKSQQTMVMPIIPPRYESLTRWQRFKRWMKR